MKMTQVEYQILCAMMQKHDDQHPRQTPRQRREVMKRNRLAILSTRKNAAPDYDVRATYQWKPTRPQR
ncbi:MULTISPECIES: hypothetical protein [Hafnia]|nr:MULTISPECIES: hypothetical protein [Hafnia]NLS56247.1 hypothetical protein [Hafnia alvei]TBM30341.1 hypothetical protein EYY85_05065 [Hafnia paralvei]